MARRQRWPWTRSPRYRFGPGVVAGPYTGLPARFLGRQRWYDVCALVG
jgi:hypothetical protein